MLQFVAKRYVDSWSSWNYLEQAVICDSLRLCQINVNYNNIDLSYSGLTTWIETLPEIEGEVPTFQQKWIFQ